MTEIKLTVSQQRVFDKMCKFVESKDERIFILQGYAGTGKTTMMKFFVEYLRNKDKHFQLLAPTGRAAKVLRDKTDEQAAQTIHSMIYTLSKNCFNVKDDDKLLNIRDTGQLYLVFEPHEIDRKKSADVVYIIDEASMISDTEEKHITQAKFGTGKLLTELLNYDKREKSKFIFIGDPCQLPPIESTKSLALLPEKFSSRGMKVVQGNLTEIIRQKGVNSIISASQKIRALKDIAPETQQEYRFKTWGKLPFRNSPNIKIHPNSDDMLKDYIDKIKGGDYNEATYICRSNKQCEITARVIRKQLGFSDSNVVEKNDLLLVIQNNAISGLMNGDMVKVKFVSKKVYNKANLTFREIQFKELVTGREYSQLLLEQTLNQDTLNLDTIQQTALFKDFIIRMKRSGIKPNTDAFRRELYKDPYLNALRCTYGYAITCHKSQGGEWKDVYVEMPRNITLNPTKSTYQWIYTAMTRTSQDLHIVDDFYLQ
ncbi:MAG: AAA family ATPase [Bacteroidales bacterium]|nr:AAA family ATPase [Bacteroidales bacterium]